VVDAVHAESVDETVNIEIIYTRKRDITKQVVRITFK
jgi:hypothetical protein